MIHVESVAKYSWHTDIEEKYMYVCYVWISMHAICLNFECCNMGVSYGPQDLGKWHDKAICSRDGVNSRLRYSNANMNTTNF